ncbi:MAG: ATP-binding protein [Chthoniobacter sp.]|uniref:slr1658 superfamily regulator n=1 Tax=Chthoniobacter sp. TaxID=2510640 RepID=UPI0032A2588B
MKTQFGEMSELNGALQHVAKIQFCAEQLALKWAHCSICADFLSQWYSNVLSANGFAGKLNDAGHGISYMANELIENAVKFRAGGDVDIVTGLAGHLFVLEIGNWIAEETSRTFQGLLEEITNGDPGELLIQRIEANAAGESGGSGLGLLTLMNDYGAKISWCFEKKESAAGAPVHLTTTAQLNLE